MNPEILGGRVGVPEEKPPEKEEGDIPPTEPEEPDKRSKIIYVPGAEKKFKEKQKKEEKPTGDPRSVLGQVKPYDKIRFSSTRGSGWRDAEVVGWEDKNHLRVALIDGGQKTGEVRTYHKSDIYAVDITEDAYGRFDK